MRRLLALLAALLGAAQPAAANPFGAAAAVADDDLAGMRGGLRLPDGTQVAIGVAIETRVDGQLALRTEFTTEAPGVRLFAGGPRTAPGPGPGTMAGAGFTPPSVEVSRSATGTVITALPAALMTGVRVATGGAVSGPANTGEPLGAVVGGAAVATALGPVTLAQDAGSFVAELVGRDLFVRQTIGVVTGVTVANTASDRVIDSVTTINVQLSGNLPIAGLNAAIDGVSQALALRNR